MDIYTNINIGMKRVNAEPHISVPDITLPPRKRGKLHYDKCKFCRDRKKKCEPLDRQWPGQKCDECRKKSLPCSKSTRIKPRAAISSNSSVSRYHEDPHIEVLTNVNKPSLLKLPFLKEDLIFQQFSNIMSSAFPGRHVAQEVLGPITRHPLRLVCFLILNGLASELPQEVMQVLCSDNSARVLASILSHRSPISDAFCENILPFLFENDNTGLLELIIKRYQHPDDIRVKCNANLHTPLMMASRRLNLDQTRLLLTHKANPNKVDITWSSYPSSISHRNPSKYGKIIRMMVEAGANVNAASESSRQTLLHSAVLQGNLELVMFLLSKGADVNACDSQGKNALHCLAGNPYRFDTYSMLSIARELFERGVDLEREFFEHWDPESPRTAIDEAASSGNYLLFQELLSFGAKISSDTILFMVLSESDDLINYLVNALDDNNTFPRDLTEADLVEMLKSDNITILQAMIRQGMVPKDNYGLLRAISFAARTGQYETVTRLLEIADDPIIEWKPHQTLAITDAMVAGHSHIVRLLINSGMPCNCDLSRISSESQEKHSILIAEVLETFPQVLYNPRTLFNAVNRRDHALVQNLLARGCNPNVTGTIWQTSKVCTALGRAAELGDLRIVMLLLEAGADPNGKFPHTPLSESIGAGSLTISEALLSAGANPDDSLAICLAVEKSDVEAVHFLLSTYPYHSRRLKCRSGYGYQALSCAIKIGNIELVNILLSAGVDVVWREDLAWRPNKPDTTEWKYQSQLEVAIVNDRSEGMEIIKAILTATFKQDGPLGIPGRQELCARSLIMAIKQRHLPAMNLLLDTGINVDKLVRIPLDWDFGKFSEHERYSGRTPLQAACEIGYTGAVMELLDKWKANVNSPAAPWGGGTALQFATIGGFIGIASELINRGADVNAPRAKFNGRTALEGAAEHGRMDMLELLIKSGANIGGESMQCSKAIELAEKNGNFAAKRLLEQQRLKYTSTGGSGTT